MIAEILKQYDTDKNNHHSYGDSYDNIFGSFDRNGKLDILEIGVQKGWSLKAWKDYFPNANIVGIDISDTRVHKEGYEFILDDVKNIKLDKEFDIIIDDGSHFLEDVLYVTKNFKLKKDGVMIIEDCQDPDYWIREVLKVVPDEYTVSYDDLRWIKGHYDDFLIIIRNESIR